MLSDFLLLPDEQMRFRVLMTMLNVERIPAGGLKVLADLLLQTIMSFTIGGVIW